MTDPRTSPAAPVRGRSPVLLAMGVVVIAAIVALFVGMFVLPRDVPLDGTGFPSSGSPSATPQPTLPAVAPSPSGDTTTEPPPAIATVAPAVAASSVEPTVVWTEGGPIAGNATAAIWADGRWLAGGGAEGRATVWESGDGTTWLRVRPIDPAPVTDDIEGRSEHWISVLVDWGDRLVAAGVNRFGFGDGLTGAIWVSADGVAWEQINVDGTGFSTTDSHANDAVIAPDGRLVIVASASLGSQTLVHTTPDGRSWTQHGIGRPEEEMESMTSIAVGPNQLLGVGGSGTAQVAENMSATVMTVWRSTDATSWEVVVVGGPGRLSSVAYDDAQERFVAGGTMIEPDLGGFGKPVVWLSSDGASWSPVVLDDRPGDVYAVVAHEGVLIAAGTAHGSGELLLWESRDGQSWSTTSIPIGGASAVYHLAVHDGRALLLVATCCEPAATRTWSGRVDP